MGSGFLVHDTNQLAVDKQKLFNYRRQLQCKAIMDLN